MGLTGFSSRDLSGPKSRHCPRLGFLEAPGKNASRCIQLTGGLQFLVFVGLRSLFPCWLSGGATFSFQRWLNSLSHDPTLSSSHSSSLNPSWNLWAFDGFRLDNWIDSLWLTQSHWLVTLIISAVSLHVTRCYMGVIFCAQGQGLGQEIVGRCRILCTTPLILSVCFSFWSIFNNNLFKVFGQVSLTSVPPWPWCLLVVFSLWVGIFPVSSYAE